MTHEEEFRAYMKAASEAMVENEQHLSEARMMAYCRRELPDAEREAAQSHLVNCEECVALFRSVRDFVEPASPDDEEIDAAQTETAWQSLLQRLPETKPVDRADTNVVHPDFARSRGHGLAKSSRLTLALAAALLVSFGVLGLLGWQLWQEQKSRRQSQQATLDLESRQRELEQRLSQVEQSGADQLNREREQRVAAEAERDQLQALLASVQPERAIVPVYPFTLSSERGSAEDLSLSFKKGVTAVKMRLFRSKPYEFPEYGLELVDQRGQVVRQISGLRPAPADGALSLQLNRAKLETGKYKLKLIGVRGKAKEPLGEYGLSVTVQP